MLYYPYFEAGTAGLWGSASARELLRAGVEKGQEICALRRLCRISGCMQRCVA
jgi:hypothetical protein